MFFGVWRGLDAYLEKGMKRRDNNWGGIYNPTFCIISILEREQKQGQDKELFGGFLVDFYVEFVLWGFFSARGGGIWLRRTKEQASKLDGNRKGKADFALLRLSFFFFRIPLVRRPILSIPNEI